MKKSVKKNQVIIAALTVLLGVAGYINFSGNTIDLANGESKDKKATESAFAETDPDVSNAEITIEDTEELELNSDEENIGEAVLTSTGLSSESIVNAKLNREQVRSKAKEYYLEIINGDNMEESSVASATDAYIRLTEDMEKEAEAETLLNANGFGGAVVSIGESSVDVIIAAEELSDTDRAKIEDIVVRKTGCGIEQIIITVVAQ